VDSAFNQDQSEFTIPVVPVLLQMLPNIHCLFDQMVQIFWDLWGKTILLKDSENLAARHSLDLWDTIVVSEDDTDGGGGGSLLGQLDNLLDQVVGRDLDP